MEPTRSETNVSDASFWEERYRVGQSGWDLGRPAPPFEALLAASDRPTPGRLAVVGCGRGNDALLFARHGFAVTGFDFAPSAIEAARAAAGRAGVRGAFVQTDLFTLPATYAGQFDYVLEHTCFCAIDPARRLEYVDVVRDLLRPGGELIALFFAHDRSGGPPFTTDVAEVRRLFSGAFTIDRLEPAANSVESRRGQELFGRFRRL